MKATKPSPLDAGCPARPTQENGARSICCFCAAQRRLLPWTAPKPRAFQSLASTKRRPAEATATTAPKQTRRSPAPERSADTLRPSSSQARVLQHDGSSTAAQQIDRQFLPPRQERDSRQSPSLRIRYSSPLSNDQRGPSQPFTSRIRYSSPLSNDQRHLRVTTSPAPEQPKRSQQQEPRYNKESPQTQQQVKQVKPEPPPPVALPSNPLNQVLSSSGWKSYSRSESVSKEAELSQPEENLNADSGIMTPEHGPTVAFNTSKSTSGSREQSNRINIRYTAKREVVRNFNEVNHRLLGNGVKSSGDSRSSEQEKSLEMSRDSIEKLNEPNETAKTHSKHVWWGISEEFGTGANNGTATESFLDKKDIRGTGRNADPRIARDWQHVRRRTEDRGSSTAPREREERGGWRDRRSNYQFVSLYGGPTLMDSDRTHASEGQPSSGTETTERPMSLYRPLLEHSPTPAFSQSEPGSHRKIEYPSSSRRLDRLDEPAARLRHRSLEFEEGSSEGLSSNESGSQRKHVAPDRKMSKSSKSSKVRPRNTRYARDQEDEDDLDDDVIERIERHKKRKQERKEEKSKAPVPIHLPQFISVNNLATALRVRGELFEDKLSRLGFENVTPDLIIDAETAGLVATEFGFEPIVGTSTPEEEDLVALPPPSDTSFLLSRPPVVTIMGHVDHGKTTLLDWLRKSSIAASEHGGITQHIGAFTVEMPSGGVITFLDTPGHAAFLDMRARGANVTDIVVLVVAADDSVKPQTIEAIKHAKAAKVPIIVAISKMDKENADANQVKQDLARYGVEVEDFGGDTQVVTVSGKTGLGMEELEDAIVALADVLDVRADTTGQVEGWILEATKKSAGKVATVLVRRGTLQVGDVLVAGSTWTRARILRNEAGIAIDSAEPGTPVEVDGWREQPEAGAEVIQAPDEHRARNVAELRIRRDESKCLAEDIAAFNEDRRRVQELRRQQADEGAESAPDNVNGDPSVVLVPLVLRGDVSGSVEAVQAAIEGLGNAEVRPSIVRSAVGPIAPSDVELAETISGHIISFNTLTDKAIALTAEKARVRILESSIIYRLIDDVKSVLEERLPPKIITSVTGEAEIAQIFEIKVKKGKLPVAGCKVRNGMISTGSKVRILRNKAIVYDGTITSLKNVKKEVTEMRKGTECGMSFDKFEEFQEGDQVQCYETKQEKRYL